MNKVPYLEAKNITKNIALGKLQQRILKKISYKFFADSVYCLYGPSGAGKTTLLNILGAVDCPSQGAIFIQGQKLSEKLEFYRRSIGFLFQENNLIVEYNVLENIMLPLLIIGKQYSEAKSCAEKLLKAFSLDQLALRSVLDLSGGEKQRIALVRAVVHSPRVLICDEPTACLDSKNSRNVIDFIFKLKAEYKLLVIIATHDRQIIDRATHRLHIFDGQIKK
jgi:ABC-type lipoprotein export system ATPase subunit